MARAPRGRSGARRAAAPPVTISISRIDKRGAERPVAALAELQVDQVADHHPLAAAQDARDDVGAECGDEDQDRARDHARPDQRQDDPGQRAPAAWRRGRRRPRSGGSRASRCWRRAAGPSAAGRHRPCRGRPRSRCRASGSAARSRPAQRSMLLITPSLRISSMMAKVRTSRLHQNGTVIRNSQKLRLRLGRVAMNQAVGKAEDQRQRRRQHREQQRAPEDRQVRVGPLPAVVEDVLLQEQVDPGLAREHPLHAGIVAGRQERVDQDDHQRADGADREQQRGPAPAAASAGGCRAVDGGVAAVNRAAPGPSSRPSWTRSRSPGWNAPRRRCGSGCGRRSGAPLSRRR